MSVKADLLISQADLPTVYKDPRSTHKTQPDSVAVAQGKIIAVGRAEQLEDLTTANTTRVDAAGGALIPGINDAHLHFTALASVLYDCVDISERYCSDWAAVASQIRKAAESRPSVIKAHGWDELRLGPDGPEMLRTLGVDVPVILFDQTGHQVLANDALMRAAGVTRSTPDPAGGLIGRHFDGEPNGLFVDAAMELAIRAVPESSRDALQKAQLKCQTMLHSLGITSITEPGIGPGGAGLLDGSPTDNALDSLTNLAQADKLTLRTNVLLLFSGTGGASAEATRQGIASFLENNVAERHIDPFALRIAGVKIFADGTPRSGTAWMSAPYGTGCSHGSMVVAGNNNQARTDELHDIIRVIHEAGLQAGVHATGDATTQAVVDAVQAAQRRDKKTTHSPRHYVIHGAFDGPHAPEQLNRMSSLGMGYSTNPLIRYQSGAALEALLGEERFAWHQPLASAERAGLKFTATSDAPVSSADWRGEIIGMVSRTTRDHSHAINPAERISSKSALASMTSSAAWQDHAENTKGTIATGQLADLCLLEKPWPRDEEIHELASNLTRNTWRGGQLVHGSF